MNADPAARKFITVVSLSLMIFAHRVSLDVFALIMTGCLGWLILRVVLWRARLRAWDTVLGFVPVFMLPLGCLEFSRGPSFNTAFFAFMAFYATEGLILTFFRKRISTYCRIDLEPEVAHNV